MSAASVIWTRTLGAITESAMDFQKIGYSWHSVEKKILLKAAQDLYRGRLHIPSDTICDPQSIADDLFRLIISAFVIRRFGRHACFRVAILHGLWYVVCF